MKYIPKNIQRNEPIALKKYRETTENPTYKGFNDNEIDENGKVVKEKPLKNALLQEQGHICAYCMGRISAEKMSVEHYISQERPNNSPYTQEFHAAKQLDYSNMLGVCVNSGIQCDKSRGNAVLSLSPLEKSHEALLTYTKDGRIVLLKENPTIEKDINEILCLNNEILKENRKVAIDFVREKKLPQDKQWTKRQIQNAIADFYEKDKDGRYQPYCQAVIFVWEKESLKNKYL